MLKSSDSDRHSRRHSAGSRSSLSTVRPIEHSRSPSRPIDANTSGVRIHLNSYNGSVDGAEAYDQHPIRFASAKRSSGSGSRKRDSQPGQAYDNAHAHKWSQSTASNSSKEHKRRSSLSSKLGLPASLSMGMTRHTPSPSRKRRPADIAVTSANHDFPKAATLAPFDMLAQTGTFYTLESPMFAPDKVPEPPRSPLLHDFQIQGDDASSTPSHQQQPSDAYRAAESWSPPGSNQYAGLFKPGQPLLNTFTRSAPSTSDGLAVDNRQVYSQHDSHAPEMEQKKRYVPLKQRQQVGAEHTSEAEHRTSPQRRRNKRSRDSDKDRRKTMLAVALHKATEAVDLDRTQDFPAALDAYKEACTLLSQVADRSSRDVDKHKLQDIRDQYRGRVREIEQADVGVSTCTIHAETSQTESGAEQSDFGIPRPSLDASHADLAGPLLETARLTGIVDRVTGRLSGAFNVEATTDSTFHHAPSALLTISAYDDVMPAPLSPRRPPPLPPNDAPEDFGASFDTATTSASRDSRTIDPSTSHHLSWLDGAEDALPSSPPSSHHSISSLNQVRRKHLRMHSTNTEAEFDAALDAAVEAAYDDGYEPTDDADRRWSRPGLSHLSRQGNLPSDDPYAAGRAQRQYVCSRNRSTTRQQHLEAEPARAEKEEERSDDEAERILDRAHESFASAATTDTRSNASFPRQSDSSSSSGRTWGSSAASSLNTAGTSLHTVDENSIPIRSRHPPGFSHPPPAPPPTTALPLPPMGGPGSFGQGRTHLGGMTSIPLQDRRLSGRKGKSLKIETAVAHPPAATERQLNNILSISPQVDASPHLMSIKTAPGVLHTEPIQSVEASKQDVSSLPPAPVRGISSPFPTPFQATFSDFSDSTTISPAETNLTSALSYDSSIRPSPFGTSHGDPFAKHLNERGLLHNNGSSASLRSRGLLTPGSETDFRSPVTPLSASFSPINIMEHTNQQPRARPRPLEPCPESQLLRPYWLMRCMYQTIVHPDGGFLTTKLCIPRTVWFMNNVKLKHVEDKVTYCDLLTSALNPLRSTDTLDADAVLAAMEVFETVMSQVQSNLTKKLGSEVGPQSISTLFKEAPANAGVLSPTERARQDTMEETVSKTNSTGSAGAKGNSRGYFSLRKLRGKQSDAQLAKTYTSVMESTSTESLKMSTVPMTSSLAASSNRAAKRDGRPVSPLGPDVKTEGPNASYMGALGRLCDAVQVLDQIARQVEDPGLKHSSQTHVGLELSSKHASDFFGLYICRFVLQDITMLAEKHVKKASEYVLA